MKRVAHISGQHIVNISLAKEDAILAPGTMLEADALRAGYIYPANAELSKRWANGEDFLQEFTMQEMAGISLSTDVTIAALRILLAVWNGEVWSDDPRVVAGLDAVESAGIINADRKAEILAK